MTKRHIFVLKQQKYHKFENTFDLSFVTKKRNYLTFIGILFILNRSTLTNK